MCRLTAVITHEDPILLADIVTKPRMSIIHQSFDCKERQHHDAPRDVHEQSSLNGDGFGVGWYAPPLRGDGSRLRREKRGEEAEECDDEMEPCVFTSLKPAWSDRNLYNIAEKVSSHLVFAHVRAAAPGSGISTELSCHPFRFGRFLFMHNGFIGDFVRLRRPLLDLLNDEAHSFAVSNSCIDSVLLFALFINQLTRGPFGSYNADELRLMLQRALAAVTTVVDEFAVESPSLLNCVVTDGETLLASRYAIGFGRARARIRSKQKESLRSGGWASCAVCKARSEDGARAGEGREGARGEGVGAQVLSNGSVQASTAKGGVREDGTDLEEDDAGLGDSAREIAASLYFASGTRWEAQEGGDYRMEHTDRRSDVAIVTSEPLTEEAENWVPVPPNHIVVVTRRIDVLVHQLPAWTPPHKYPVCLKHFSHFGSASACVPSRLLPLSPPETSGAGGGGGPFLVSAQIGQGDFLQPRERAEREVGSLEFQQRHTQGHKNRGVLDPADGETGRSVHQPTIAHDCGRAVPMPQRSSVIAPYPPSAFESGAISESIDALSSRHDGGSRIPRGASLQTEGLTHETSENAQLTDEGGKGEKEKDRDRISLPALAFSRVSSPFSQALLSTAGPLGGGTDEKTTHGGRIEATPVQLQRQQIDEHRTHPSAQQHVLTGHEAAVLCVTRLRLDGTDYLVTGGQDGYLRVWDAAGFRCKAAVRGHKMGVLSLCSWAQVERGSADQIARECVDHNDERCANGLEPLPERDEQELQAFSSSAQGGGGGEEALFEIREMEDEQKETEGRRDEGEGIRSMGVNQKPSRVFVISGSSDNCLCIWDFSNCRRFREQEKRERAGVRSASRHQSQIGSSPPRSSRQPSKGSGSKTGLPSLAPFPLSSTQSREDKEDENAQSHLNRDYPPSISIPADPILLLRVKFWPSQGDVLSLEIFSHPIHSHSFGHSSKNLSVYPRPPILFAGFQTTAVLRVDLLDLIRTADAARSVAEPSSGGPRSPTYSEPGVTPSVACGGLRGCANGERGDREKVPSVSTSSRPPSPSGGHVQLCHEIVLDLDLFSHSRQQEQARKRERRAAGQKEASAFAHEQCGDGAAVKGSDRGHQKKEKEKEKEKRKEGNAFLKGAQLLTGFVTTLGCPISEMEEALHTLGSVGHTLSELPPCGPVREKSGGAGGSTGHRRSMRPSACCVRGAWGGGRPFPFPSDLPGLLGAIGKSVRPVASPVFTSRNLDTAPQTADYMPTKGVPSHRVPLHRRPAMGNSPMEVVIRGSTLPYTKLHRHVGFVESLAVCGRYVCSGGGDGLILVWKDGSSYACALSGHRGGVMVMVAESGKRQGALYSGSRDRSVRVWDLESRSCKAALKGHTSDVLSLSLHGDVLFSGSASGEILAWSTKSLSLCFTIVQHQSPHAVLRKGMAVTGLAMASAVPSETVKAVWEGGTGEPPELLNRKRTHLFATAGDGCIRVWRLGKQTRERHRQTPARTAPEGTLGPAAVRSACAPTGADSPASGGSDRDAAQAQHSLGRLLTSVSTSSPLRVSFEDGASDAGSQAAEVTILNHSLEDLLRTFVSFQSVSSDPGLKDECWSAAHFLASCLEDVGAEVKIVDVGSGRNPLVAGRLGRSPVKPTVVLYSHYDVVPANRGAEWRTDPWSLCGVDGFLYGRGVTDNKGPIAASLFAVKELAKEVRKALAAEAPDSPLSSVSPRSEAAEDSADGKTGLGRKRGGESVSPWDALKGLPVNVVWLSEGEEENGSGGFREALKDLIEAGWLRGTSCIVACNSYWIDDERPCLVYGMRGCIDVRLSVTGGEKDLHSGVHGGAIVEPLHDLLAVTSTLVDSGGLIIIPGFYSETNEAGVEEEQELLECAQGLEIDAYRRGSGSAVLRAEKGVELLQKRWCEPSLSVTEIWTSTQEATAIAPSDGGGGHLGRAGGPSAAVCRHSVKRVGETFRVLPCRAVANVNIRFIPEQDPKRLISLLTSHVQHEFRKTRSKNKLEVRVEAVGDAWRGNLNSSVCRAAGEAIEGVWGVPPLLAREGGTMPVIRLLQDTLEVAAIQLPLGQASDSAHLPNERMRAENLRKGVDVLKNLFRILGRVD
uniref:Glutamine amidotransferase type-2 domain-containing protein n=1 Tax=Chromera velia CCMP2878 TaxID=1169474 RepID=A0A0G4GN72_9ALVE|eukprot:Cvel_22625.t1-p1 / transcript=Cvel_22625.t1 / gene=Cvel_22625 / organism=Chromera_velia_CCMP2878 / gene_product=Cys-Gly metallodipeptidase DUG1, putative / transcript_product=Cys-Gly metallodipeptidase DUG1, putative / location=Cvel_scaffold2242:1173-14885(+) / protein_length=2084 / sequence_SO=supercontig / SO=protein_coding / is_pseudo=false